MTAPDFGRSALHINLDLVLASCCTLVHGFAKCPRQHLIPLCLASAMENHRIRSLLDRGADLNVLDNTDSIPFAPGDAGVVQARSQVTGTVVNSESS